MDPTTLFADARQRRREVFAEVRQIDPAAEAAEASRLDHHESFSQLDALARLMKGAGAPEPAVRWCIRQADIAYRAARSEGHAPMRSNL